MGPVILDGGDPVAHKETSHAHAPTGHEHEPKSKDGSHPVDKDHLDKVTCREGIK